MDVSFDPAKNETNIAKHGLSLAGFEGFDAPPLVIEDDRFDYGEIRYRAFGFVGGEGRCLVFTVRGEVLHAISYRRAHAKEMRRQEREADR